MILGTMIGRRTDLDCFWWLSTIVEKADTAQPDLHLHFLFYFPPQLLLPMAASATEIYPHRQPDFNPTHLVGPAGRA